MCYESSSIIHLTLHLNRDKIQVQLKDLLRLRVLKNSSEMLDKSS